MSPAHSSNSSAGGGAFELPDERAQPMGSLRRRRRGGPGGGFRNRTALHSANLHYGPNMTPMVDIVMVILIFFMASAAFLGSEWFLNAAIPFEKGRGTNATKANDPLELPAPRLDILLDVDASGRTVGTFLELKQAPLQDVLNRIAGLPQDEQTKQLEVIIRPTASVPYRDVVATHSACDAAGIYKVGIGVSKGGAGK